MKPSWRELLALAAERGIITAAQRDALAALAAERDAGPEVRRGFNSVTIAYGVGALFVAFGFGWFLADRWDALGPTGVLLVALAYAVLLTGIAVWLDRRGFVFASGIALLAATSLTPIVSWALQTLAGLWPLPGSRDPLAAYSSWMALRWVISELATIGVALVAYRWRRHVVLTIPMAVALWGLWIHTVLALIEEPRGLRFESWQMLANALAICAIAGAIDRHQAARGQSQRNVHDDAAGYFWVAGLLAFVVGYGAVWFGTSTPWKHLLPLVAITLVVMSLYLRRRLHLAVGILGIFGYLAWLGGEVFKNRVSFPVLLATLGILLILVTVGVQRRFPALVQRVNAGREGQALPRMATLGPFLLVAGIAATHLADIPEERAQQAFRQRLQILQGHSGSARARGQAPPGRTVRGTAAESTSVQSGRPPRPTKP